MFSCRIEEKMYFVGTDRSQQPTVFCWKFFRFWRPVIPFSEMMQKAQVGVLSAARLQQQIREPWAQFWGNLIPPVVSRILIFG